MIFALLVPPQGPRGWDPQNGAVACAIHASNSNTKYGWISEKNDPPNPKRNPPKSHPWGMTQAAK